MNERINEALDIARRYGQIDGDHHKTWVIDQMVRALTGCLKVIRMKKDVNQRDYTFEDYIESDEYKQFILDHNLGKDGLDTYEWDTGIAP